MMILGKVSVNSKTNQKLKSPVFSPFSLKITARSQIPEKIFSQHPILENNDNVSCKPSKPVSLSENILNYIWPSSVVCKERAFCDFLSQMS